MKNIIIVIFITHLFCFESNKELAEIMELRPKPDDIKSRNQLIIKNKNSTKTLELISKSKDDSKLQMIWFLKPKDDKGIAFLKKEEDGKDDFMIMWLPGFKRFRRIASSNKTDSFMGSDLTFEDLTNRNFEDYTYPEIPYEVDCKFNDKYTRCYVLTSIPKPETKKNSDYGKHETTVLEVEKDIFIAIQEDSYDVTGKIKLKTKELNYDLIVSDENKYYIMDNLIVNDVQESTSTTLTVNKISINNGFTTKSFNERTLKRLP